jgi:hypothetical protein
MILYSVSRFENKPTNNAFPLLMFRNPRSVPRIVEVETYLRDCVIGVFSGFGHGLAKVLCIYFVLQELCSLCVLVKFWANGRDHGAIPSVALTATHMDFRICEMAAFEGINFDLLPFLYSKFRLNTENCRLS